MNTLTLLWMTLVAVSYTTATEFHAHFKRQAEILASLPSCVQNCLLTAFSTHGTVCSPTDFACLCKLQPFVEASAKCYVETCTPEDQKSGVEFGQKVCVYLDGVLKKLITKTDDERVNQSCASVGVTLPDLPIASTPPPTTPTPPATGSVSAPPVPPTTPALTGPCIMLGTEQNATLYNGTKFNVTFPGAPHEGKHHNSTNVWSNITVCPPNTTPTVNATASTPPSLSVSTTPKSANFSPSVEMGAWSAASKSELSLASVFLGSFIAIINL